MLVILSGAKNLPQADWSH